MSKLLSANFARLVKSRVFWTLEIFCMISGAVMYGLVIFNTGNLGKRWLLWNANSYFFFFITYIGAVLAVFATLFIGTEYSDGTIRNKISIGHRRCDIYFSNLIIVAATGAIFCITHMLMAVLIGIPFVGTAVLPEFSSILWRLGCVGLIVLAYAALFTLFAMLDGNKSRAAVISLILALVLAASGMLVFGRLQEPKLTSRMVMQADGSFERQENIPNSRYVDGTARTVYEWIDVTMPSAQALHILQRDGEFDSRMPFCGMGLTVLLTAGGITCFRRKDIR